MTDSDKVNSIIKSGLRSVAASFPGAATVAQAWNEYETKAQFSRIKDFFQDLKLEIETLKDQIEAESEYIEKSGEIPSLIERTIDRIKRENSEKKRKAFAHLLANSIASGKTVPYDDKITFIDILDTLTEQDIKILSLFKTNQSLRVDNMIERGAKIGKLVTSLSKLESRGIIGETDRHGADDTIALWGDANNWENRWRVRYFELLPDGVEFKKMVLRESRSCNRVGPR